MCRSGWDDKMIPEPMYRCPDCDVVCRDRFSYEAHYQNVHIPEQMLYYYKLIKDNEEPEIIRVCEYDYLHTYKYEYGNCRRTGYEHDGLEHYVIFKISGNTKMIDKMKRELRGVKEGEV